MFKLNGFKHEPEFNVRETESLLEQDDELKEYILNKFLIFKFEN